MMGGGGPFATNVRRLETSRGYGAGGEHAERMEEETQARIQYETLPDRLKAFFENTHKVGFCRRKAALREADRLCREAWCEITEWRSQTSKPEDA